MPEQAPEPDPKFIGMNRDPFNEALEGEPGLADAADAKARAARLLRKIIEGSWGDHARAYVLGGKNYHEMVDCYQTAIGIRDLLDAIADQNQAFASKPGIYTLPHDARFFLGAFSLRMVPDGGGAALEPREALKPFLAKVELERIKRCAKCQKIFWPAA